MKFKKISSMAISCFLVMAFPIMALADGNIIKKIKGSDFVVESKKDKFTKVKNSSGRNFPENAKYYLITGNVKVKNKNIPLEGLQLYIKSLKTDKICSSGLTDKNGNYQVFVLEPGKYTINIDKGYANHFNLTKCTPKEGLIEIK